MKGLKGLGWGIGVGSGADRPDQWVLLVSAEGTAHGAWCSPTELLRNMYGVRSMCGRDGFSVRPAGLNIRPLHTE